MIRKLVRSFYRLRYFPRQLFEALNALDRRLARVEQAQMLDDGAAARLDAIQAESASFAADFTRALLRIDQLATQTAARTEALAEAMRAQNRLREYEDSAQAAALHSLPPRLAGSLEAHLRPMFAELSGKIVRLDETLALQEGLFPSWFWTPDIAARTRAILALLRPHQAQGYGKRRLGRDHDGGYVMLDDFAGIGAALSLGIADDVSWDLEIAAHGIDVLQFDPTVPHSPASHPRFSFDALWIAPQDGLGSISIATILADRLAGRGDRLILKIDIEGAEWNVLAGLSEAELSRFAQITGEFHTLERLAEAEFAARAGAVFARLARTHFVVHVHGNNCANFANVANVMVPQSLEISFASRRHYTPVASEEIFPTALDQPNEAGRADLFLGAFRFDAQAAAPQ